MKKSKTASRNRGRGHLSRYVERDSGDRPSSWVPRPTQPTAPSSAFLAALEQQRAALSQAAAPAASVPAPASAPIPTPTPFPWLVPVRSLFGRVRHRVVGEEHGRQVEALASLARLGVGAACTGQTMHLIEQCPVNSYSLKSFTHGPFHLCRGMPYMAPKGVSAFWCSYQGAQWREDLPVSAATRPSTGRPCIYSSALDSGTCGAFPVEDPAWDVHISTSGRDTEVGDNGGYDVLTAWASDSSHGMPASQGSFTSRISVLHQRYVPGRPDPDGRMNRTDVELSGLSTGFVRGMKWMRAAPVPHLVVCGSGLILQPHGSVVEPVNAADAVVQVFAVQADAEAEGEGEGRHVQEQHPASRLQPTPVYTLRSGGEVSVTCQILPYEGFTPLPPPGRTVGPAGASSSLSLSSGSTSTTSPSTTYDVGAVHDDTVENSSTGEFGSALFLLGRRNGSIDLWDVRAPCATTLCTLPTMVADIQPVGPGGIAQHGWLTADIDAHAVVTDGRMWGRPRCAFIRYKNTVSRRHISMSQLGDAATMVCADGIARVWDTGSGRPRLELAEKAVSSVFTRDAIGLEVLWVSTVKGVYKLGGAITATQP